MRRVGIFLRTNWGANYHYLTAPTAPRPLCAFGQNIYYEVIHPNYGVHAPRSCFVENGLKPGRYVWSGGPPFPSDVEAGSCLRVFALEMIKVACVRGGRDPSNGVPKRTRVLR